MKQQDQGSVIFPLTGVFKCCAILWPCLSPMSLNSMGSYVPISIALLVELGLTLSLLSLPGQHRALSLPSSLKCGCVLVKKQKRTEAIIKRTLFCSASLLSCIFSASFFILLCFCVIVKISIIAFFKNFNFWWRICPGASIQEDLLCVCGSEIYD